MQALQERALARIWCSHAPYRAHNRFGSGDMLRTGCPGAQSFKHTSEPVLSLLLLNLEQDIGLDEAADNPIYYRVPRAAVAHSVLSEMPRSLSGSTQPRASSAQRGGHLGTYRSQLLAAGIVVHLNIDTMLEFWQDFT
jgi:hypothetical protein